MKKYFTLIIVSLIIGFFLSYFVLHEYTNSSAITVYKEGEQLYFFKYGEYQTKEEMEVDTLNLENYIYQHNNNLYKVYIGVCKNENNIDKIKNYYKDKVKEVETFYISNRQFINDIDNLDNILISTDDNTVIGEIINQQLSSYEKVVKNDNKN